MQEMQETELQSLGREDPLEKEMEIHSRILAWEIPWTEEPGGPQSRGSQSRARLSMHASGPSVRQRKGVGVPSCEESGREVVK